MEKTPVPDLTAPIPLSQLEELARLALFAALVGAGAFVHLPFGPLHFTLQTMMVMLTGFVLGPKKAGLSIILYLACGFIGVPVFGRGRTGPTLFLGPSAGYLAGFVAGAVIAGISAGFQGNRRERLAARFAFGLAGTLVLLFLGAAGIKLSVTGDWQRALAIGMYPFLPGDCLKLLAAIAVMELRCSSKKTDSAATERWKSENRDFGSCCSKASRKPAKKSSPPEFPSTASFPRRLDARLKLPLLLAACFATQHLPDALLFPWLAILASLFVVPELRRSGPRGIVRGGLVFALFWLTMKTVFDWLGGLALADSLAGALPLAGRLAALTTIGAAFTGLTSAVETGRAASWFLTPLTGGRVWKPALAVALTVWFLPQTIRLASAVSAGLRARGLEALPWRKKALLLVGTSLRILERKAGELAVGLASRRLDTPQAWKH